MPLPHVARPRFLLMLGMSGMLLLAGCGASDEGKPVNPVEQLAWLRSADRSDPEVGKFLERENQASEQALTTERALQETLLDEMLARLPAYYDLDHRTAGEHRYFERWSVHHADQGELWRDTLGGGEPERLLSGVDEAAGSAYYSLGAWAVDEAEQWLAVAEDRVGNEAYTLRVRNMAEGSWQSIAGAETVSLAGLDKLTPRCTVNAEITMAGGKKTSVPLTCRIDTEDELDYFRNGGILHYVLRGLAA